MEVYVGLEAKCISGNRKEADLMQLYKNCIHVVCKGQQINEAKAIGLASTM